LISLRSKRLVQGVIDDEGLLAESDRVANSKEEKEGSKGDNEED
jgi:hypothetical protein